MTAAGEKLPGILCGKYRVMDDVGRGATGRVLRVEHLGTGEILAMKLLLRQDPAARARFRREARALARIKGDHVVRIIDADLAPELDDAPFIVMELLVGQDAGTHVELRGRLPPSEVVALLEQVALGLAQVHAHELVHRDLKPENIFLHRVGKQLAVKLLDFGLVKTIACEGEVDLTRTGTTLGTPLYMSPEQVRGDSRGVGTATDIWAVGMLAFKLLTGHSYWRAPTMATVLLDILTAEMVPPSSLDPLLPPAFDAWFARSCAREPADRWPSAEAQSRALAEVFATSAAATISRLGDNLDATMAYAVAHPGSAKGGASDADARRRRRQVTALFYALSPADPRAESMDPEEFEALERRYGQACADALGELGDTLTRSAHGGHFVFFGYPVAYGDDARRAVEAGLRLCAASRALGAAIRATGGCELRVRVGIHTGVVLAGGSRGSGDSLDLVGPALSVATQLERRADPDEVLVGSSTWRMLAGRFRGAPIGGEDEPVRVTAPVPAIPGEDDAPTGDARASSGSMIGRVAELDVIAGLLRAVASGRTRSLLVVGEPGIGKSRLLKAHRDAAAHGGAVTFIEAQCSPYFQRTAYHPLGPIVSRLLGGAPSESGLTHAELVAAAASAGLAAEAVTLIEIMLGMPPSDAPLVARLSPQLRRQMTMDTILQLVRARSRRGPLCLVIEDVHWADPSTLELAGRLAQITDAPLLTVFTARPEIESKWQPPGSVTVMELRRLAPPETRRLLEAASGDARLPEEMLADLTARTDGVPLFAEELGRLFAEAQRATPGASGAALLQPLAAAATSLRDSLTARLDRLGEARPLAELAAVLGTDFERVDLEALAEAEAEANANANANADATADADARSKADTDPARFAERFAALIAADVVRPRGPAARGGFAFRHALLRDAAYEAFPREDRRRAHGLAAGVLSARAASGGVRPELLAHHFAEAGQVVPAAGLLIQAGQDALERAANAEAVGHFRRGMEILGPAMPAPEAVGLLITHATLEGFAWIVQRGYAVPEVEAAFGRAGALLAAVGAEPPPELLPALWGQWVLTLVRGRFTEAERHSAGLLRLAERAPDPGIAMLAHLAHGTSLHGIGRFAEARGHLERAIALYDPAAHGAYRFIYGQDPLMFGEVFLAWALWALGEPDSAAAHVDAAVAHAESLQHPNSLGFALALSALVHHDRGDTALVLARAAALDELSARQGWLQWTGHALQWAGAARVRSGAVDEGLAQIRQGRAIAAAVGERSGASHYDGVLVDALLRAGQLDEAAALIASVRGFIAESGEHGFESDIDRLEGTLAEKRGDLDAAESRYRDAIARAEALGARSYALRAATALAALERRRGVAAEQASGRAALHRLLATFTEGRATADLTAAAAELRAWPGATT